MIHIAAYRTVRLPGIGAFTGNIPARKMSVNERQNGTDPWGNIGEVQGKFRGKLQPYPEQYFDPGGTVWHPIPDRDMYSISNKNGCHMGPEYRCQKRVLGPAGIPLCNFHDFHGVENFHGCFNFHGGRNAFSGVEITKAGTRIFTGFHMTDFHVVEKVEIIF